jgi:hypothetical protein
LDLCEPGPTGRYVADFYVTHKKTFAIRYYLRNYINFEVPLPTTEQEFDNAIKTLLTYATLYTE